jgi:hypothetical protein
MMRVLLAVDGSACSETGVQTVIDPEASYLLQ